jgi:hypothetical protein
MKIGARRRERDVSGKAELFKFSCFFLKLHASALRTLKRDSKGSHQIYVSLIRDEIAQSV